MGGGGGGGGFFSTKRDLDALRGEAVRATQHETLEGEINAYLNEVLAQVNDRDVDRVRSRLEEIADSIHDLADETVEILFGGSVAKHTYVDGLSDVDALMVIASGGLPDSSPDEVRAAVASRLAETLPAEATVTEGTLAVTVSYTDGTEIQLLPAVRRNDSFLIASADGSRWSEIKPRAFASKLTEENARLNGRLVPAIKLVKTIVSNYMPEDHQPTGYHLESLAIEAASDYDGPGTPRAIVGHLFRSAADRVLRPIQDSTGQSRHVDDYLGAADSLERRVMAHNLDRVARRIEYATSLDDWKGIVGVD